MVAPCRCEGKRIWYPNNGFRIQRTVSASIHIGSRINPHRFSYPPTPVFGSMHIDSKQLGNRKSGTLRSRHEIQGFVDC
eukprot:7978091-Pyramimonas_sp.AAC.1